MFEENQIEYWVQKEILSKITELLERKHLYQSVSLDREALNQKVQEIEQSKRWATKEELEWEGSDTTESLEERKAASLELSNRVTDMLLTNAWKFEVETCVNPSDAIARRESVRQSSSVHVTVLPLIKITCNHCKGILPAHVSGCLETWAEIPTYNPKGEDASESFLQIFNFPYQCQNCRGEPVVFIVRREGLKLTLVGRSLF
ncbi:MAG: hypothetical protein JWR19_4167, partial [Pedosphaera sp.]|nr:hypothetical protein [Pedosphaera sp.]